MNTRLVDDGTLDTVVEVSNTVYRFNVDIEWPGSYDDFVDWCIDQAEMYYQEEHEKAD